MTDISIAQQKARGLRDLAALVEQNQDLAELFTFVRPSDPPPVWTAGSPEPPAGVDVLHELNSDAAEQYLCRLDDGDWEWFADPNDRSDGTTARSWEGAACLAEGPLYDVTTRVQADRLAEAIATEPARTLAVVLREIVEHDTDYAVRYRLIVEALSLALEEGLAAGLGIDNHEPDHPVVVYIELPTGQISWHMPRHPKPWDRHTTPVKFERIKNYIETTRDYR